MKLRNRYTLILIFSVLIGGIALTHALTQDAIPPGMTCAQDRIASFGWTDKRAPLAELAAIASWQKETEKKKPGYGNWHHAFRRSMKCRTFKNSSHVQCVVSARPCRYGRS